MKCDTEKRHHKIGMNSAEASQSALEFEKKCGAFWLANSKISFDISQSECSKGNPFRELIFYKINLEMILSLLHSL